MAEMTVEDMLRIAQEADAISETPLAWLEREGISHDAMHKLGEMAIRSAYVRASEGQDDEMIITQLSWDVFMLGWECGREYGRARRRNKAT